MQQRETPIESPNKERLQTTPRQDRYTPGITDGGPNKWVVLAILAVGIIMATLDSSIVNISLPTIATYFHVPLNGEVEWVIIAYLVVIAGVLLTIGRLADMVGRKILWVAGLIIFTLGSAISGASITLLMLIIARAFQGLGGALIMSVSPAMLTSAFPPQERGRALGMNAVAVALGTSIGPTLGGLITANFSWRWIFYVNVPLGILGVIATLIVLKERHMRTRGRFDPAGASLLAVGLVALTLGLSFGQEWGWSSLPLIASLVISLLAFIAIVFIEQQLDDPIIDFSLLRNRVFVSANVSLIMCFLALFAVSFMLPFYLEELRGLDIIASGLLLTPLPLTIAFIAPFSGALADRIGTRWLAACGLALACVGLILLSQLNAHSSIGDIVWRLIVTGIGQAIFQSPNNSALMGSAPRDRQGVAAGFLATGRVMGQSVSVALAGAVFTSMGGAVAGAVLVQNARKLPLARLVALQNTFTSSFHAAFIVCAGIAAVGVLTSLVRGKEEISRETKKMVAGE
ncbi:MAG TPA: MFS transporter [Ktedonobacteraceae bacterium]|nr:MFS transporter [Ktedonobacteraceae bacterium]